VSVSEWREVTLGDVCDSVSNTHPFEKAKLIFLNTSDVYDGSILHNNYSPVAEMPGQAKKSIKKGDILYSEIRPKNKRYAMVNFDASDYVVSTKFMVIRSNGLIVNKFLYLYLTSNEVLETLQQVAEARSGTFPQITFSQVAELKLNLPPIPEQKAIVATLSALDDMIELNNQINKTLEEMAQAIFKSWFVDFEPFKDGEFEESELGLIPKGWRVGVLEDIAFINTETINPQNYPETFFEHFSIPLFDEGKFSAFEKGEVIKSNKYVIDSSCMLFSKLNPQFKRVFRPFCKTSKAICSTEFMVYKAKKPIYNNYIYSTLCSGSFHQFVMQNVTGTTNSRQRAIPKNTLNFKMLIPDENALSSYNQIISGIFNIMQRIPEDNKLLSSIRDTILPKLMSGEIRVPVEEVV
jgi:type I restriction enzyme S subunit